MAICTELVNNGSFLGLDWLLDITETPPEGNIAWASHIRHVSEQIKHSVVVSACCRIDATTIL